jgi:hypothetical protein
VLGELAPSRSHGFLGFTGTVPTIIPPYSVWRSIQTVRCQTNGLIQYPVSRFATPDTPVPWDILHKWRNAPHHTLELRPSLVSQCMPGLKTVAVMAHVVSSSPRWFPVIWAGASIDGTEQGLGNHVCAAKHNYRIQPDGSKAAARIC